MKRVIGILTTLLMLHLMVMGSDLACATHGQHANVEHSTHAMLMAGVAEHADALVSHDEPAQPCETPVTPSCCAALASCGTAYDLGRVAVVASVLRAQASPLDVRDDAPASRRVAPETPPPRA